MKKPISILIIIVLLFSLLASSGCIKTEKSRRKDFIKGFEETIRIMESDDINIQITVYDLKRELTDVYIFDGNKIEFIIIDINGLHKNDGYVLTEDNIYWVYFDYDDGWFRTGAKISIEEQDLINTTFLYGYKSFELFKNNFEWFDYDKKTKEYILKSGHSKEIYYLLNEGKEMKEEDFGKEYQFSFKFDDGKISEYTYTDPFHYNEN